MDDENDTEMADKFSLGIGGKSIKFIFKPELQERLINETMPGNKVTPMHNFLIRVVDPESKEDLKPFLRNPGSIMEIGSSVMEQCLPKLNITVGE